MLQNFLDDNGQDLCDDESQYEKRDLDVLHKYLLVFYPNIEIHREDLKSTLEYLSKEHPEVYMSYLSKYKPNYLFDVLCEMGSNRVFVMIEKLGLSLISCDQLKESEYLRLKSNENVIPMEEIRNLVMHSYLNPFTDYNSCIIKFGDKEYCISYIVK